MFGMVQQGIVYAGWNPDWFKAFLGVMLLAPSSSTCGPADRDPEVTSMTSNGTGTHGAILQDSAPEGEDGPIVQLRNAGKSYGNIRACTAWTSPCIRAR